MDNKVELKDVQYRQLRLYYQLEQMSTWANVQIGTMQIANALGVTSQTIFKYRNLLEKEGLISLDRGDGKFNFVKVSLTPKGLAHIKEEELTTPRK